MSKNLTEKELLKLWEQYERGEITNTRIANAMRRTDWGSYRQFAGKLADWLENNWLNK